MPWRWGIASWISLGKWLAARLLDPEESSRAASADGKPPRCHAPPVCAGPVVGLQRSWGGCWNGTCGSCGTSMLYPCYIHGMSMAKDWSIPGRIGEFCERQQIVPRSKPMVIDSCCRISPSKCKERIVHLSPKLLCSIWFLRPNMNCFIAISLACDDFDL